MVSKGVVAVLKEYNGASHGLSMFRSKRRGKGELVVDLGVVEQSENTGETAEGKDARAREIEDREREAGPLFKPVSW